MTSVASSRAKVLPVDFVAGMVAISFVSGDDNDASGFAAVRKRNPERSRSRNSCSNSWHDFAEA